MTWSITSTTAVTARPTRRSGKFIRELFGQTDPRSVAEDKHSKTAMLEESARLKQRAK